MAGPGIRIDMDVKDAELRAALRRLQRRVGRMRPVMEEIAANMLATVQRRFETESGPGGRKWPRSGRARRDGGQTLADRGRLLNSYSPASDDNEAAVGTNVVYAAVHQFGHRIPPRTIRPRRGRALFWPGARHPVAKVDHPGATIPARPALGFDDRDRVSILRIVSRHLERSYLGA